ncbi:MAG TPA: hypothetical protein VF092_19885 [Longimicrobium sp.]
MKKNDLLESLGIAHRSPDALVKRHPHVTSAASPSLPQSVLGEGQARSARERARAGASLHESRRSHLTFR